MDERLFKVGDRVFDILYGWGKVTDSNTKNTYGVIVNFDKQGRVSYTKNGSIYVGANPSLSFTEYSTPGFSQDRPIELPEVGELCLVRDFTGNQWKVREFRKFTTYFLDTNGERWSEFKRIKILD
jgi:hypothetical protein